MVRYRGVPTTCMPRNQSGIPSCGDQVRFNIPQSAFDMDNLEGFKLVQVIGVSCFCSDDAAAAGFVGCRGRAGWMEQKQEVTLMQQI